MTWWTVPELTSSSRLQLIPNELEHIVQPGVGLYDNNEKVPAYQLGRAYLTTHRLVYIGDDKKAISLSLEDIDSTEYVSRFMRSSPKIVIKTKKKSLQNEVAQTKNVTPSDEVTWVCPICFFVNKMPLDPSLKPVCGTCGIAASDETISEAMKSASQPELSQLSSSSDILEENACPRCTFVNHPSMTHCELCGARLISRNIPPQLLGQLKDVKITSMSDSGVYKLSFRSGGDRPFYQGLKTNISSKTWEIQSISPDPKQAPESTGVKVGIYGLQKTTEKRRDRTNQVLETALDDLQSLVEHSESVLSLAKSLAPHSPAHLLLQTVAPANPGPNSADVDELARQIVDYLTSTRQPLLTLFDLFANYNRARSQTGADLVSPRGIFEACQRMESIGLPIVLKSVEDIWIVAERGRVFENEVLSCLQKKQKARNSRQQEEGNIDTKSFNINILTEKHEEYIGITAVELASMMNWSFMIATEELRQAELKGILCRDDGISGSTYYINEFKNFGQWNWKEELFNDDIS